MEIIDIAFSPNNQIVAVATICGNVTLFGLQEHPTGIFKLDETEQDTSIEFDNLPHLMAFTSDSKSLVLSSRGNRVDKACYGASDDQRWVIRKNTISSWGFAHGTNVMSPGLTFPDGVNFLIVRDSESASVTARSDGHSYAWEIGTSEAIMNLNFEKLDSIAATTVFSPDATIKAVASGHDIILTRTSDHQIWHVLQGDSKGGHQSQITAFMFSRDGKTLFSASEDGQLIAWSIDDAIQRFFPESPPPGISLIWNQFSLESGITSLELNFDQTILAVGHYDGRIGVVSISGLQQR
jgi:WD40 repeat protein